MPPLEYVVWFLGFQPGFPYLGGMPEALATPRRADPRVRVPAGSVGIGGTQTGIYPLETPGGWNLIGRTELALFNPQLPEPTLLRPRRSAALYSPARTVYVESDSFRDLHHVAGRQTHRVPPGRVSAIAGHWMNRRCR